MVKLIGTYGFQPRGHRGNKGFIIWSKTIEEINNIFLLGKRSTTGYKGVENHLHLTEIICNG